MLRRYLIVNGIATALLYAAVWAFVPSVSGLSRSVGSTVRALAEDSPILGPVLNRVVTIGAR
jgi:hypothetical protein